jgi:hypothetical protein
VPSMEVTFTKAAGRRYVMTVVRERGPRLAPRQGPGYDDHLPHDAVHFLVEAEARLSGGVFGQIAAGQNNIFWPADPRPRERFTHGGVRVPPGDIEIHDRSCRARRRHSFSNVRLMKLSPMLG